jgi:hypothetical protein
MTLAVDWWTIDALDPKVVAIFWPAALGYDIVEEDTDEFLLVAQDGSRRRLLVGRSPDLKTAKNRLDLPPDDQEAEVRRLGSLGARRVDIGQGEITRTVMADPEGNEFCGLRALRADEGKLPFGD